MVEIETREDAYQAIGEHVYRERKKKLKREAKSHAENACVKSMLVSTMKMNLVTLVLIVFIVPRHLLTIYYTSCYLTPGGCDEYLKLFNKVGFLQICVVIILPAMLTKMIDDIC